MFSIFRTFTAALLTLGAQCVAAQQPAPPKMTMNAVALTILIKGSILALQQANMTGNYSVLRDLGTPVFRETFDQARLTDVFASLRARKIDLSLALVLSPNLTKAPELNHNNELVLAGDFPTLPLQIHFEIAFYRLDGAWRIAGLSVDAVPAPSANAQFSGADLQARGITQVSKTRTATRAN